MTEEDALRLRLLLAREERLKAEAEADLAKRRSDGGAGSEKVLAEARRESGDEGLAVLARTMRLVRQAHERLRQATSDEDKSCAPHVTLTFAQSIDGCIARVAGHPTSISCPESFRLTHRLRAQHDAIVVGVNTVAADNPSLTTRFDGGRNPQPVILDPLLRLPGSCKLLTNDSCLRPWVIGSTAACHGDVQAKLEWQMRRESLMQAGALVFDCPLLPSERDAGSVSNKLDLAGVLGILGENGVSSVMVEGGAGVIRSILSIQSQARLVGSIIITIAPAFFGGFRYGTELIPQGLDRAWALDSAQLIGTDVVIDLRQGD